MQFALGGRAFYESTPAVLTYYQAQAGLELVLSIGVERLRNYSLYQQNLLCSCLQENDIDVDSNRQKHGAFISLPHQDAEKISKQLMQEQVITDAREGYIRVCPDILNTSSELEAAGTIIARQLRA